MNYYEDRRKCGKCGWVEWTHPWLDAMCCGMVIHRFPATKEELEELDYIEHTWRDPIRLDSLKPSRLLQTAMFSTPET